MYPTNKTYLYLDFQPMTTTVTGCELCGCRWSGSPTYMTFSFSDYSTSNYQLAIYAGDYQQGFIYILTPNNVNYLIQRHIGEIDPLNHTCRIDNYTHSINNSTYSSTYSFFLFAFNNRGSVGLRGSVRIYECKFNENNIPIRHFIPALRDLDQKPGLYDLVNNQFYTNAGTGEFLYA